MFPYRLTRSGNLNYALLRRADSGDWQGIAGGGELGESPDAAAQREAHEEAGIAMKVPLLRLSAVGAIPVSAFAPQPQWDPGLESIPEYSFGIVAGAPELTLSAEHSEYRWLPFSDALPLLSWESNRVALRELHERLVGMAGTAVAPAV